MISKLAAVLAVFWLSLSIPSIAFAQTDGYLDNDGQMDIKTDRLQMSETEKKKEKRRTIRNSVRRNRDSTIYSENE
ncbi:secreted protein, N-terminal part [Listeria grayi FSL F6-1183]|uniref:Secreted protein, N-terminal part n=2 Tax=Listeria grayi TaxID=1641 RepID=A0A829R5X3_LISGR|nr:secreted protein, N-terminal part [Listeria grayi FSL F6-1183]